jgi:hypothetical protein
MINYKEQWPQLTSDFIAFNGLVAAVGCLFVNWQAIAMFIGGLV